MYLRSFPAQKLVSNTSGIVAASQLPIPASAPWSSKTALIGIFRRANKASSSRAAGGSSNASGPRRFTRESCSGEGPSHTRPSRRGSVSTIPLPERPKTPNFKNRGRPVSRNRCFSTPSGHGERSDSVQGLCTVAVANPEY
jgi:hypothetical protein